MAISSPLTDADYDGIKRQLDTLQDLDAELKKAAQAGIDVTAQKEQARQSREQLLKLKQTYFPNKP